MSVHDHCTEPGTVPASPQGQPRTLRSDAPPVLSSPVPFAVSLQCWADRDVVTVRVRGELDVGTAPVLAAQLYPVVGRGRRRLHIDMSDVGFCDVSGLNLLLDVAARQAAVDGIVTVKGACRSLWLMLGYVALPANLVLTLPTAHVPDPVSTQ
jgi:anti-anti-sigma factor